MKHYEVTLADSFNHQFRERQLWWYENREKNPFALDDEVEAALLNLVDAPWIGQRLGEHPKEVRSLLLQKCQHRIAFRISADVVDVFAIWDVRKPPIL